MSEELKQKALERIKLVDFEGQFFLEMFIGGGWTQASTLMEREVAEAYRKRWAEFVSQVCEQREKRIAQLEETLRYIASDSMPGWDWKGDVARRALGEQQ